MESGSNYNVNVLCTRPVPEVWVKEAAHKGIGLDILSFIDTVPIDTVEVQQEVEHALILSSSVVFTSMNAVEAVARFMVEIIPDWRVYCIGHTTQQLVVKYFGEEAIAGTAEDAASLAELIIEEGETEEVIFFCGDRRRDELPGLLLDNDIDVEEIIVYQTITVAHHLEKDYQAVLFFSPSAVHSFFSANKLAPNAITFAIGSTTAESIQEYTDHKIILAEQQGKEALVQQMIDFFS